MHVLDLLLRAVLLPVDIFPCALLRPMAAHLQQKGADRHQLTVLLLHVEREHAVLLIASHAAQLAYLQDCV
jgi:hypothetical protein